MIIPTAAHGSPAGFLESGHQISCHKGVPVNISDYIPTNNIELLQCYRCDCPTGHIRCFKSRWSTPSCKPERNISRGQMFKLETTNSTNFTTQSPKVTFQLSGDISTDDLSDFWNAYQAANALGLSPDAFIMKRERLRKKLAAGEGTPKSTSGSLSPERYRILPEHICWIIDETSEMCREIQPHQRSKFITGLLNNSTTHGGHPINELDFHAHKLESSTI